METLMILILLTFVPIKGTDKVEISYEAKLTVMTYDQCKLLDKDLTEDPPKGKTPIVLCVKSSEPKPAKPEKQSFLLETKD